MVARACWPSDNLEVGEGGHLMIEELAETGYRLEMHISELFVKPFKGKISWIWNVIEAFAGHYLWFPLIF